MAFQPNGGDATKIQGFPVSTTDPVNGQTLVYNNSTGQYEPSTPAGGGDVVGPASSTDVRIAVFDGVSGKAIKDGGKTVAELTPPVKATGAELDTGTDDAKFATAKALADSDYVKNDDLGTMATETATDYLTKAGNLSGLADAATARTNLGIDSIATKLSKLDATTAPAVTDDNGSGYAVGSVWVDVTADKAYVCVDSTVGAAVWKETTINPTIPTRDSLGLDTDDSPQFAGINLGNASDTTITRTGAGAIAVEGVGVVLTTTDVTGQVTAASDSAAGKVELATASETSTGTDAIRAVTPDALAGSDFGKRAVQLLVVDFATDTATGDGKFLFRVPSVLNGMNLVAVAATVFTAGTTGTTDIQLRNVTDSVDILSTKMTIDSGETDTLTAATAAVIDTTKDDVATGDIIAVDVDAVSTTKAKGLTITLTFQLP